jgi:hypothetical protein
VVVQPRRAAAPVRPLALHVRAHGLTRTSKSQPLACGGLGVYMHPIPNHASTAQAVEYAGAKGPVSALTLFEGGRGAVFEAFPVSVSHRS